MVSFTSIQTHIIVTGMIILINDVIITHAREVYPSCMEKSYINRPKGDHDECIFFCPRLERPVCDSAHHTHKNECTLCRAACIRPDRKLAKQCDGPCPCKGDAALNEWAEQRMKMKEKSMEDLMFDKHQEGFQRTPDVPRQSAGNNEDLERKRVLLKKVEL